MNPVIKKYRNKIRNLSRQINTAEERLQKLNDERNHAHLQIQRVCAQDCIDRHNKYIGKWIVGRGVRVGTFWYKCDFLIKPAAFVIKEYPRSKQASAVVVGSILWKYDGCVYGPGSWRPFGKKDNDGKIGGRVSIFNNMHQTIRFRLATKKDLDENRKVVNFAEKYAPTDFTSLIQETPPCGV